MNPCNDKGGLHRAAKACDKLNNISFGSVTFQCQWHMSNPTPRLTFY